MAGTTLGGRNWAQRYGWGRMLSALVVVFGIWQMVAPYLLNFAAEQVALRNAIVCGVLLVIFGGLGFYGLGHWQTSTLRVLHGLAALTGLWLCLSPFALNYQDVTAAFWNAIVVGVLSLLAAGIATAKFDQSSATA